MEMLCFVLWMICYPLVVSYSRYVSFLSGKVYSDDVLAISSLIYLVIWIAVGSLIWSKV